MLQSSPPSPRTHPVGPALPLRLVGIARLASEGSLIAGKQRVEYRTLPTRKWLNRCHSTRVPFHWTINPYRGCEFGCKYCYARFTHEFMELRDPSSFETEIYAKEWQPDAFRDEMRSLKPGHIIGLGTATDPYQPAERKFKVTRQLLRVLADARGISLFVTTKSDLVSRDAELYLEIAKHNEVRVSVTITTMSTELARLAEPFAPRPDLRLRGVRQLAEAGVPVGVIASPILPMITDSEANLTAVARAAKNAGATQFGAGVLFLQPSAYNVFIPFIGRRFPALLRKYQASYNQGAYLKGAYPERMAALLNRIRESVGIPARDLDQVPMGRPDSEQLRLF